MRPILVLAAVVLLLGAVTTVAVAWCLAVVVTVPVPGTGTIVVALGRGPGRTFAVPMPPGQWADVSGVWFGEDEIFWWGDARRRAGLLVIAWEPAGEPYRIGEYVAHRFERAKILRVAELRPKLAGSDVPSWSLPRPDQAAFHIVSARGWPLPALWYRCWYDPPGTEGAVALSQSFRRLGPGERLPYHIAPLGFALDTVFYAALWALLILGPARLRRLVRRRLGRCAGCGYDLAHAGHTACPECGQPR